MAAEAGRPLTPEEYAVFGRWVAALLADAWRNGLRRQEAEGRASAESDARPQQAGEEKRRGLTTRRPAGIVQH